MTLEALQTSTATPEITSIFKNILVATDFSPASKRATRDALVLAGMLALMAPFILTHRQSYIFHYLGAYGLGLGLLASRIARLERRSAAAVVGFLVCTAVVSFIYLPLWTGSVLTPHGFELRLPFPGWR